MKSVRRLLIVGMLVVLAAYLLCQRRAETPAPPKGPKPVDSNRAKLPEVVDQRHLLVDKLLRENRIAIGQCLLRSDRRNTSEISLTLTWDVLGKLNRVMTRPNLGEKTHDCLTTLISPWPIPAGPDLAPLSVGKSLRLR